jgi:RNA polymerase sigma factor (sigma-70 family)
VASNATSAAVPIGVGEEPDDRFESFVITVEPRLRRALVAALGPELGREATAEALAYAWEHRTKVLSHPNPLAYLIRVGRSRSRKFRRRLEASRGSEAPVLQPDYEPGLAEALMTLPRRQREAVTLCVGFGWTLSEVAAATGVSRSTVQRHLDRGLARLQQIIGPHLESRGTSNE